MKKTALVTGANKGLGFETSRTLAKKGIKVWMGARNENRGKAAAEKLQREDLEVVFLPLDMADPKSIKKAADTVNSACDTLDILINNAGLLHEAEGWTENSTTTIPMEALRATFETNFFGVVALTQQLLPLLRKSKAANIVNVSSILGSLTLGNDVTSTVYPSKPFAYNTSKAALNAFTIHLAAALKEENIRVNAAHPGWVKTDMGTEEAPMSIPEGIKTIVDLALHDSPGYTGRFVHRDDPIPW